MAALELRDAAEKGDCGKLRELLDGGGGASLVDERTEATVAGQKVQTTALIQAVGYGQHAVVELLLEHGAIPNIADSLGGTPLMAAAGGGQLPILRMLLDRKAIIDAVVTPSDVTAFHWACINDHADCAVELARRGCDMTLRIKSGETGKQIAERKKNMAVLAGLRALVVEQLRAKLRAKQQAVAQPHDPLTATTTAQDLRIAARSGDCGKLRELLDGGGASVLNERTEGMDEETGEKIWLTALIQAVNNDQHSAVELLLEHNANPNMADSDGFTPLMHAAVLGQLPILQTLLDRKDIVIDAVDSKDSFTAFHTACFSGQAGCAVELARHGCNTKLRTNSGLTGKDIAEDMKQLSEHAAVLQGLRTHVLEQLRQSRDSSSAPDCVLALATEFLYSATKDGNCKEMRELLDVGGASIVDERTQGTEEETGEKFQTTALFGAAVNNQQAAVELLLEHSANPNVTTSRGYGTTPLMEAAAAGRLCILQMLLESDAIAIDAAEPENDGTAFHVACVQGHADCAVKLIEHGCNTQLLTGGLTGWDLAKQQGHGGLIRRCKGAQKLALRKARQQGSSKTDSPTPATKADGTAPQVDEDPEEQAKAAKKAAANRKKKERKKAKKAAAQQQLSLSQTKADANAETKVEANAEPEPEIEAELEPEPAPALEEAGVDAEPALLPELEPAANAEVQLTEPEPELDEHTQQLQALTELGVQQWSATQVLEWVALIDLPPESVPVLAAALESMDVDNGDELLELGLKTLQRKLAKRRVQNAEALAKQVIEQRDALLLPGDTTAVAPAATTPELERPEGHECPICMELFGDDESGQRIPRILTNCGHTVCHGCITDMLALVTAKNGKKACKCPTCSKVTNVKGGNAANLHKNYALL